MLIALTILLRKSVDTGFQMDLHGDGTKHKISLYDPETIYTTTTTNNLKIIWHNKQKKIEICKNVWGNYETQPADRGKKVGRKERNRKISQKT